MQVRLRVPARMEGAGRGRQEEKEAAQEEPSPDVSRSMQVRLRVPARMEEAGRGRQEEKEAAQEAGHTDTVNWVFTGGDFLVEAGRTSTTTTIRYMRSRWLQVPYARVHTQQGTRLLSGSQLRAFRAGRDFLVEAGARTGG